LVSKSSIRLSYPYPLELAVTVFTAIVNTLETVGM